MIDAHAGPSRANGTTWQPPTATSGVSAAAPPTRPLHQVDGQPDTQLEQAVRRAAQMRTIFYVVVLLMALTGQVTGATQKLDIPLLLTIPAVGALELGGVVVMANADVRRRLGERALASRILSAAIAAGAVAFNWLAHDNHLLGGFFAGMSCLGYLVWLVHVENMRRDRLRAIGALAATTPAYEVTGHWLRHPLITRRARAMAKADPGLGLYGSLDAARAALHRERRDAAIVKVLRRKIKAAVDPTTAAIAVHVYNLDQIAARLADTADYDGLTNLIAADLTPARIANRPEQPKRRPFRRWRSRAGRNGSATKHLPARDDTSGDAPAAPQRSIPAHTPAEPQRPPHQAGDVPDLEPAVPHAKPAGEHGGPNVGPDQPPRYGKGPRTPTPTNPESTPQMPGETAAAVAYWLDADPNMGYDEIARRIGRTERTVRRNLPPGFHRPRRARGRT